MVKQEWRQLKHNTWFKVVLVAIIVLPCIYAGVFLGSMWSPYEKTDLLPVAIVNEDESVDFEGKQLQVGDELVRNLKKEKQMEYHFVDAKEAKKGLADQKYTMIVTIPKDFSKNATTLLQAHPTKMVLTYTTNPGSNYIASKMDESAVQKMKEAISASVTKTYGETMFAQVQKLSNGFGDASEGSFKIMNASGQLQQGSQLLTHNMALLESASLSFEEGSQKLNAGVQAYDKGVFSLHDGLQSLKEGLSKLVVEQSKFSDGLQQIKTASSSLNNGVVSYASGVDSLSVASQTLNQNNTALLDGVSKMSEASALLASLNTQMNTQLALYEEHMQANDLAQAGKDMEVVKQLQQTISVVTGQLNASMNGGTYYDKQQQLQTLPLEQSFVLRAKAYVNGVVQVNDALQTLASNATALKEGSEQLQLGAQQLQDNFSLFAQGVQALQQGSEQAYQGSEQLVEKGAYLVSGSQNLASSAPQFTSASAQLKQGSQVLQEGMSQLYGANQSLYTNLNDAAKQSKLTTSDKTTQMLAQPVALEKHEISTVKNNGHAMAPYMMSVALYVACLSFALMYPLSKGVQDAKSIVRFWLAKASVSFFVASVAAILMVACLCILNGFAPKQLLLCFVFAIVVALAFMSLITLLSMLSGKIGEFLLLVFMVINLGGSAGTYPLQTSPAIYQAIHPYLPFTYSVDGFRKVISQSSASIQVEMGYFLMMLVVCSVLSIIVYRYQKQKPQRLIPQAFEENNE